MPCEFPRCGKIPKSYNAVTVKSREFGEVNLCVCGDCMEKLAERK